MVLVFFQVFLLSRLQCTVETVRGCVSLKKWKSQGKAVEVTANRKEENSEDFCLVFHFHLRIQPQEVVYYV
jgi:hypothetical protein